MVDRNDVCFAAYAAMVDGFAVGRPEVLRRLLTAVRVFDLARRVLPESSETRGLDEPHIQFPVNEFEANESEWIEQVFDLPFPVPLKIDGKESAAGGYGSVRRDTADF